MVSGPFRFRGEVWGFGEGTGRTGTMVGAAVPWGGDILNRGGGRGGRAREPETIYAMQRQSQISLTSKAWRPAGTK